MSETMRPDRREFLGGMSAIGAAALAPAGAIGQQGMPARPIPSTGEMLPVIGLGSSKVVQEIATEGEEPLAQVLRTLVDHGGRLVDTWPRDAGNDAAFGRVISAPDLADHLFVTTKIDRTGREAGIAQFRESQRLYRRNPLDLAQIFSLTDLETHWPTLEELKAAGETRYIGVTVAEYGLYDRLLGFLDGATPDFVQVNYSITERRAEEQILPRLQEQGIAALINRPFMNGAYFRRLEEEPLPEWITAIGCESWAQFSLRYILANSAVTCVLTETTNPEHMAENSRAALGAPPDADLRERMRAFMDSV